MPLIASSRRVLSVVILCCAIGPLMADSQIVSETTQVSIMQLIVTPEKFDGRVISVEGFLVLGRERDVLFAHEVDATHLLLSNGLLVDRSEQMGRELKELDKKYVRVVGAFKFGGKHTMPFAGTISDVQKCEFWSDPVEPVSKRLKTITGAPDSKKPE